MKPKFVINPFIIPAAILILILVSNYAAYAFRVPTFSESDTGAIAKTAAGNVCLASFEVSGLSCFGTSKTFAKWVKELPGILKIRTFSSNRSAEITYDKTQVGADEMIMSIEREVKAGSQVLKPFSIVRYRESEAGKWTVLRSNKKIEVDEL